MLRRTAFEFKSGQKIILNILHMDMSSLVIQAEFHSLENPANYKPSHAYEVAEVHQHNNQF
jgi:hypothetical protein